MQLTDEEKQLLTHWLHECKRLERGPAHELILEHRVNPGDLGMLVIVWERSEGIRQAAVVSGDRPNEPLEWPWMDTLHQPRGIMFCLEILDRMIERRGKVSDFIEES